ncbi:MAG: TerB N-terminal domain-containing protein [Eubacterium sp.]|nr:TerB N-terminal domain-containing protein [Eubacterium sp.]
MEDRIYSDTPIPRRDSLQQKDLAQSSSEQFRTGTASSHFSSGKSFPDRGSLRPPKNGLDFGRRTSEWEFSAGKNNGTFSDWQPASPGRDVPIPDMLKMLIDTFDRRDLAPMRKPTAFYRQACMMSAYEDDYVYTGEFNQYFPFYQNMNAEQLRGYFGWRTRLRQGNYTECPASFVFLYLYEIINKIGYEDPRQGLKTLEDVISYYSEAYPRLHLFRTKWIRDYIICYNLPQEDALRYFSSLIGSDESLDTLNHYASKEPEEIFQALCQVAGYQLQKSVFYKKKPEDCIKLIAGIYGRLSDFYQEHYYRTLAQRIFGLKEKYPYRMFESALYLERGTEEDYSYTIGTARTYRRHNGRWTCERYMSSGSQPTELNAILRESDRQMRDAFDIRPPLKKQMYSPAIQELIAEVIENYKQELAEAARPKVHIDLSRLSGIREDADYTRDQLLEGTEEAADFGDASENSVSFSDVPAHAPLPKAAQNPDRAQASATLHSVSVSNAVDDTPAESAEDSAAGIRKAPESSDTPYALTPDEVSFLKLLLAGKPWQDYTRTSHLMVSVLCDSINEKLYNEFQDTVIDMDNDQPVLIEDYIDDLRSLLS